MHIRALYVMVLVAFALTGWSLHRAGEAEAASLSAIAAAKAANTRLDKVVDWQDIADGCTALGSGKFDWANDCGQQWLESMASVPTHEYPGRLQAARKHH